MNTKVRSLLALLSVLPAIAWAQAKPSPSPSPGATPSFPTQVELVVVDAVVKDKKGAPVTDLKQSDFTVLEDGQAQGIVSFEAVKLPDRPRATPPPKPRVSINTSHEAQTGRSFVVVFDDIHLSLFQARRAKIAVAEFLKTGVREGDRVTLVATGGGAWWSARMESGREELLALLKRLDGRQIPDRSPDRLSDFEAMRIHVYRDQEVGQRVSRRFEAYGASARAGTQRDTSSAYQDIDPLVSGRAQEIYYQASSKNRITLAVVERVLQSLATTRGRKSMILVSEGFIFDPNLDEFKQVVQASRRANVAIYFLNTKGLQGAPDFQGAEFGPALPEQDIGAAFGDALEAAAGAESIASDSGGFTVANTNDLGKGIQRIADDSRAYYLLGYVPQNAKQDGRFRKIALKVNRKGIDVRARKGYFASLEGAKAAEKKPSGPDPDIQAALDSPFEEQDIPLRMTAHVFDETLLGKAGVVVTTEVDISRFGFEEREGRLLDSLEFLLVVAHRESGEYLRYDQKVDMKLLPATKAKLEQNWFPISRDFELAPGGYQAKIVVRDKNNGSIGTVIHEFEVPDLGQLRTSSLVLTDTLQPQPEASQDSKPGPPRTAVVARRSFPSGAMLFAQVEVYGAAKDKAANQPKVSSGYVVRGTDGTVLAEQAASTIMPTSLGKLSRLMGFRLDGAQPGEYEMILSVKDEVSGKALEVKEPFTVVESR